MKSLYTASPMFFGDEPQVRALYKLCHPGMVVKPTNWYFAHPTLVVITDGKVVGFTSFTIVVIPGFGETLYGKDMCVHPDYGGRGIAKNLHLARLVIGHRVGARIFMGVTTSDNKSMIRILEGSGMHPCIPVGDDILFIGPIKGT